MTSNLDNQNIVIGKNEHLKNYYGKGWGKSKTATNQTVIQRQKEASN